MGKRLSRNIPSSQSDLEIEGRRRGRNEASSTHMSGSKLQTHLLVGGAFGDGGRGAAEVEAACEVTVEVGATMRGAIEVLKSAAPACELCAVV